jgi:hypothetical protein
MSSNTTPSSNGVFSSLPTSKKDSLKQVIGEAANLFDKFKNKRNLATTESNPTTSSNSNSIPQSSSFSSLLASAVDGQTSSSSLLQNLAISFHKSILNNQNTNTNSGTSVNATSSTIVQETPYRKSSSLVIIDDESFDDDEASFDCQHLTAKNSPKNFKTSQSEFNLKNVSIINEEQEDVNGSNTSNNHSKITSSTSLYKVTPSMVNDFSQEDTTSTASEGATLLRNRFPPKIKSNELSEKEKDKVEFFYILH